MTTKTISLQSHIATPAGFIKPSIPMNFSKDIALMNSMGYSLQGWRNADSMPYYCYRGFIVKIDSRKWDRTRGVLSITITIDDESFVT